MQTSSRLIYEAAGCTFFLGVLGTLLFDTPVLGLNGTLWVLGLCGGVAVLTLRWRKTATLRETLPFAGIGVLGMLLLLRDAPPLTAAIVLGLLGLFVLFIRQQQVATLHPALRAGIGQLSLVQTVFSAWLRLIPDTLNFDYRRLNTHRSSVHATGIARGLLLTAPLLLVFGTLLASADQTFERILLSAIQIDIESAWWHIVRVVFFGGLAAGVLRGSLFVLDVDVRHEPKQTIGATEIQVILGSIALLFGGYVMVQLPYFFGGLETVLGTRGLTIAQYAREGFFELSWVASLSLLVLFGLHTRLDDTARPQTAFRQMALVVLLLLTVMLMSAGQRMLVYVGEFGLSAMRLYVSVFLVWAALVFFWFGATVLRSQRDRFVPGAAIAGFVLLMGLTLANPEAQVVRFNIDRASQTRTFDVSYALSLSTDVVPTLAESAEHLPSATDRSAVADALLCAYDDPAPRGWKGWTWSRSRAYAAVQMHQTELWWHASDAALNCSEVRRPFVR
ncbi:hypothetical protein CRI94_09215 [Longibacter salinarum]|uniref:Uncharacterized protein n=1 Tax=Longibacter salinarum TaxID=1850348 RepID=A0A2A8CYM6_9BACT|nr:DUF4173 domain-containing protein [Longibacter salinarum]PEN13488.1 hypothetical protein CRI94_09215 [Longibacter salinarum]